MNKVSRTVRAYDEEFDVVVVGYGFAGAISAIEAAHAGAKVLLIENASVPGGISICSYGSVRCASDSEQAYSYLSATNGGRTPDDVVRVLADGMSELEPYVRHFGTVNGAEIMTTKEAGKVAPTTRCPASKRSIRRSSSRSPTSTRGQSIRGPTARLAARCCSRFSMTTWLTRMSPSG